MGTPHHATIDQSAKQTVYKIAWLKERHVTLKLCSEEFLNQFLFEALKEDGPQAVNRRINASYTYASITHYSTSTNKT